MKPIQQQIVNPASVGGFINVTITKIAAIVLTLNEENLIKDCLLHLRPHVDWLLLLDGGSTDKTIEKASRLPDHVITRPFSGSFANERNYAQDHLPPEYKWVLHCDVDERFPTEFLQKMKEIIATSNVDCFRFPRINQDMTYRKLLLNPKDHQVRLLNRRVCQWVRPVHEIVWHKIANKPADQHLVKELSEYPITHLKRTKDQRKTILNRWKTLEKQQHTTI